MRDIIIVNDAAKVSAMFAYLVDPARRVTIIAATQKKFIAEPCISPTHIQRALPQTKVYYLPPLMLRQFNRLVKNYEMPRGGARMYKWPLTLRDSYHRHPLWSPEQIDQFGEIGIIGEMAVTAGIVGETARSTTPLTKLVDRPRRPILSLSGKSVDTL